VVDRSPRGVAIQQVDFVSLKASFGTGFSLNGSTAFNVYSPVGAYSSYGSTAFKAYSPVQGAFNVWVNCIQRVQPHDWGVDGGARGFALEARLVAREDDDAAM
jgi:hypothetical protein